MSRLEHALILGARIVRAWRYYRRLHYSWRLAWVKAGSADAFT